MRVWTLGSGSEGNATLIECGDSRVLVDAGFSPRMLARRLKAIDVAPQSIEACIVTHEHHDHARGAAAGARKWGWKLFASEGTVVASPDLFQAGCTRVLPGNTITLSQSSFTTHVVPHDSASPIGVRVTSSSSGATAVVCTDLGAVTPSVRTLCANADVLVLESNHDEGMLRAGPYPPSVRDRISSRFGHLSNRACAHLARDVCHRDLAHVVLAHLSQHCNDHGFAHRATSTCLRGTAFAGTVDIAFQHAVSGPFSPHSKKLEGARQLSLAF